MPGTEPGLDYSTTAHDPGRGDNHMLRKQQRGVSGAGKAVQRILTWFFGLKTLIIALIILVVVVVAAVTGANEDEAARQARDDGPAVSLPAGPVDDTKFDAGNIISDQVFFNSNAMTVQQIQQFLDTQAPQCTASTCLRNMQVQMPPRPATELCGAYQGGTEAFSAALWTIAQACRINPQVLLVTIEKESGGLHQTNPAAGWDAALLGYACPDTGPGGSANCNPEFAGAASQTWGLAQVFRKYTEHPGNWNYKVGPNEILYNVAEQCQQTKQVTIVNQATANLYIYTPYTPSDAAITAWPAAVTGPDAACAAYGNRNFFYLFRKYFRSTGGGTPRTGMPGAPGGPIAVNGVNVDLPPAAGITGTIKAPNLTAAKAITAGLTQLGILYSWGGGDAGGPTTGTLEGCSANCLANDPLHTSGYDCAGLMLYLWAQVGVDAPRNSQTQAQSGRQVPYEQRVAGDMIGFPGHVAMYVGNFNGTDYMLEAPYSGSHVRIAPVRDGHYANVARIWENLP